MTLDDIAASLPNGFHDAVLKTVSLDFVNCEAKLRLSVWIGEPGANTDAERELYRNAEVCLEGLVYWISEPPRTKDYLHKGALVFDMGALETLAEPPSSPPPEAPADSFTNWLFVRDWNAFVFVAARDSRLSWLD